ncbi:MAG: hypothetical protein A3G83_00750 [Betaproteobacteria bacterium RIFCSPLOWO2_12_FULL_68_20]|nr:MAG: hypothetical protein A3G83_00750 [Betaproteobacteria bacterium RIFCSPLOWO2_12_FULL_68_20]
MIAMVVVAIIVGATIYFVYPLRQATDVTVRATLTDIADNALQRIGRDVRLALPNSVRVDGTSVEFLALRTAGRYRGDGGEAVATPNCSGGVADDQLSFDIADTCLASIGELAIAAVANDYLVLNNYGPDFTGQNAYALSGNTAKITSVDTSGSSRDLINFESTTFQRTLHDSPGKRFFVITGPVRYECAGGTLTRYWNYPIQTAFPPAVTTGQVSAPIAENVTGCTFSYEQNVAPQIGLLTLRLTLSRTMSGGETETVSLYHAVHVSNVP